MTKRLDFEELSVIKLKVQFTDSRGVLIELKELDINVIDVNETPNDLHATLYEINKKSLVGDVVGNITVSLLMQGMMSYKHRGVINSDGVSKRKTIEPIIWQISTIFTFHLLFLLASFYFLLQCQNKSVRCCACKTFNQINA